MDPKSTAGKLASTVMDTGTSNLGNQHAASLSKDEDAIFISTPRSSSSSSKQASADSAPASSSPSPSEPLPPLPLPCSSSGASAPGSDEKPSQNILNPTTPKQRWNKPRGNTFRLAVCFYSFINLGLNDACYGALLPSLEAYYGLDYTLVSLIFLSPFVGYSAASFANDPLHHSVGQQGIALIGPLTRATAYLILVFHPPWPAVIVVLAVGGFGSGLCDSAWNAWIGDFASANELLGFLHGWYGAGATISPLIATSLVTTYGKPWWFFFYIPLASCLVEAGGGLLAFWGVNGKVFSRRMEEEHGGQRGANKRLRAALGQRVTWLVALFLFLYVGIEVALSGWVVTFFLRVRHAPPFSAGLTSTGFWAGLTLGRVTLGFLTPRVGERLAVTVYLLVSMGLVLIFWLVPNLYVSAVAIALVGYFIGPLFPAAIVAAAKLLKKESHIPAIGFAAAVGGAGSAVLPFAVGAIANAKGVATLEPIVLAIFVCLFAVWLSLPRIPQGKRKGLFLEKERSEE